ncbi:PHD finger-like domain-containing protein 5A isoform X1 [Motacilla alba alba]|uniref:PHD finger-like domain-containing protein 5A isoform X1 n=1 Tax=Motacilla alba alba TaxID=1094192 RepID=UPI0018D525C2|nr:PHD finger-like domain-containing protein 5A isoform X1 [Motacilla alba alba]
MASRGPFDISGARAGGVAARVLAGRHPRQERVVGRHEGLLWAGEAIGRLCEKCDGKCVICDSYVRPCTLVRICDECNYGSYQGRCVICGGPGVSDAYYCKECTIQEKDRDGCPKIVNLGSSKTDLFYERKKYGFKKR